MNKDVIRDTISKSLTGTITFSQIVGILIAEGIESYHVDLVRNENRYYLPDGDSLVEKIDLPHAKAAVPFSASGVSAAVRKVQAGKANYRQFVSDILEAGCVYYIAYISGRKVVYFGRNGDAHVENFPTAK